MHWIEEQPYTIPEPSSDTESDELSLQETTINHLPPEILGVVFELCLSSDTTLVDHDPVIWGSCASKVPWVLSQVCVYWRQVAHGNASLWAQSPKLRICAAGSDAEMENLVQSYIKRSTSQKISLNIKSAKISRAVSTTARCSIMSVLTPHFNRVEEMDLYVEDLDSWCLIQANAPLKLLKRLSLHIRSPDSSIDDGRASLPAMFTFLPSLRWITIHVDSKPEETRAQPIIDRLPHVRWFQFMPLTRLELYRETCLDGLDKLLSSASNLLELKLVDICCASWHHVPVINHPRLRSLYISADPESRDNYRCFQFAENILSGGTFRGLKELELHFEDCWFQLRTLQYFLIRSGCYLRKCIFPSSNVANTFHDFPRLLILLCDVQELTLGWIGPAQIDALTDSKEPGRESVLPVLRKFKVLCSSFDDRQVTKFIQSHDRYAERPLECVEIVVRETSKPLVIEQQWPFSVGSCPDYAVLWGPIIRTLTAYTSGEALATDPAGITALKSLCARLTELNIWLGQVYCYFNKSQEGYDFVLALVRIAVKLNRTRTLAIEAARLRAKLNGHLRRITNDPFLFKTLPQNWGREASPDCPAFNLLVYRR